MLTKITIKPGINRDSTSYTNTGGWYDSNFIRFRNGLPEKIGGWTKVYANQASLNGTCRKLYDWSSLTGTPFLAMPTNIKFYVDNSTTIIDITPLRRYLTLSANAIQSYSGSTLIAVTDTNNGASVGDYVTLSGVIPFNGLSSAALNREFRIEAVSGSNVYFFNTTETANATSYGGGSAILAKYQFHAGGITGTSTLSGWGSGSWGGAAGQYGWGYGPDSTFAPYYDGLWSVDNYGEDMVACPRNLTNSTLLGIDPISVSNGSNVVTVTHINHGYSNGAAVTIANVPSAIGGLSAFNINGSRTITVANADAYTFVAGGYDTATANTTGGGSFVFAATSTIVYWDVSNSVGPAESISLLGSEYAKLYLPYVATEVMVSDQNRQIIALGCNPYDTTKIQDKMIVRWSDSNDPTNWDISDTTKTAGEQRLSSGSFIVTAAQNREEILIWTDASLFTMTYVGPPYGYGFNIVGSNFDIIGPNAKTIAGSIAYWMGTDNFYCYDGKIQPMPCTVRDYVFQDISVSDGDKVYCSADSGNNEIIWFYPSESQGPAGSRENDRYVVYNFLEESWYYGALSRTAWIDRRGHTNPRAISPTGYLYNHESGFDDGSTTPPSAIYAYIQSSPIEIDDGDHYMFINRIIPDLTFRNSTTHDGAQPSVSFIIKTQNYPGGEMSDGDETIATRNSVATLKVDRFTDQMFTRLRARSVALRVESYETGVAWRLGTPRLDMRQDGRK